MDPYISLCWASSVVCGAAEDSSVIGRPAEFALVDADGSPSFLEKALKFIEDHGKFFCLLRSLRNLALHYGE